MPAGQRMLCCRIHAVFAVAVVGVVLLILMLVFKYRASVRQRREEVRGPEGSANGRLRPGPRVPTHPCKAVCVL